MKFGSLYQFGGAAGFTPRQVDEMSLWEFSHAARGYMSANSSEEEKPKAPSEERFFEINPHLR